MKKDYISVCYGEENFEKLFMLLIEEKINEIKGKVQNRNIVEQYNKENTIHPQTLKNEVDEHDK